MKKTIKLLSLLPPKPRVALVEKMCERCPFKPDGSGYAVTHPDFPGIVAAVEMTGYFLCHETVILDERTSMDTAGERPEPPMQDHFKGCQGAWQRYMTAWRERAEKALAGRAVTIDDVREASNERNPR